MSKYSKEQVSKIVAEVRSIAGLITALGLKPAGGNYNSMKKLLQKYEIDCSHWTGQGWNKDQQLKDWSKYKNNDRLKINLIKVRGRICECCNLDKWMDTPITIELHHIDGDRTNNNESNLQLLCPNCHSMTDNWKKH